MVTDLSSVMALEYLQFDLEKHIYYLDINCLDAVRNWSEIVEIPNTPEFIKGITIYEDDIIPVVCVKRVLGLISSPSILNSPSKMIVVKYDKEKFGIIVDQIVGIFRINHENVSTDTPFPTGDLFVLDEIMQLCQTSINI